MSISEIVTKDPRYYSLPREMVELLLETGKHPELEAQLQEIRHLDEWLAAVATYCGILVDGYFEPRDIRNLVLQLTDKLRQIRFKDSVIIVRK